MYTPDFVWHFSAAICFIYKYLHPQKLKNIKICNSYVYKQAKVEAGFYKMQKKEKVSPWLSWFEVYAELNHCRQQLLVLTWHALQSFLTVLFCFVLRDTAQEHSKAETIV